MSNEHPYSERYRIKGAIWAELDAAAQLLEDTKSAVMAQRQTQLGGDLPVNRAEQIVKASPEWMKHLEVIVEARKKANLAKIELEVIRMEYYENQSHEASARAEMRMLGETP